LQISFDFSEKRYVDLDESSATRPGDEPRPAPRVIEKDPGIDQGMILSQQVSRPTVEPSSDVVLRHGVASAANAIFYPLNRQLNAGQPKEHDANPISSILEPSKKRQVASAGKRRLESEGVPMRG
jgi:hypothetical protein